MVKRRGFLGGILGGAGVLASGQFVLTNPKVIAGDLLVPSPEPTIVRVEQPVSRITAAGQAVVSEMNLTADPIDVSRWGESARWYVQGPVSLRVTLEVLPDAIVGFNLRPGDTVDLHVVSRVH